MGIPFVAQTIKYLSMLEPWPSLTMLKTRIAPLLRVQKDSLSIRPISSLLFRLSLDVPRATVSLAECRDNRNPKQELLQESGSVDQITRLGSDIRTRKTESKQKVLLGISVIVDEGEAH